jgi:hypothetical protein
MPRPRPPRTFVERDGITFVFTHDDDDPSLLHIFARHLATIDDALGVWFDERTTDVWNDRYSRWESTGVTHVLYWTWLVAEQRVLIITCFTKDDSA